MPLSLILACLWVLAAAIVALLPMRFQYVPGLALLILSVPLAVYVGVEVGWIWVALVRLRRPVHVPPSLMALVPLPAPPILPEKPDAAFPDLRTGLGPSRGRGARPAGPVPVVHGPGR
jgi:membrane protease YdiL (CAAX protease family)